MLSSLLSGCGGGAGAVGGHDGAEAATLFATSGPQLAAGAGACIATEQLGAVLDPMTWQALASVAFCATTAGAKFCSWMLGPQDALGCMFRAGSAARQRCDRHCGTINGTPAAGEGNVAEGAIEAVSGPTCNDV